VPETGRDELAGIVRAFRDHPGRRSKRSIRLVTEVLGATDWLHGPGDDAAVVEETAEEGALVAAGEAIWPPFLASDPYGAGIAAVVANVNDVAAMGGRARAIVDTLIGSEALARSVLEGMRWAAERYDVPIVGGHLTVSSEPPALSAFVVGRARRILSSTDAGPGQVLLHATALDGTPHPRFPFFSSLREREDRLASDVEALPVLAERGLAAAAKDVSMAGLFGSLAMLLEPTRCGVVVDLDRVPVPEGVSRSAWVGMFPSFGFLVCVPPASVEAATEVFAERGLACEPIGALDDSGRLAVASRGEEAELFDLRSGTVTGLGIEP
jgi:hypothetical protein